MYKRRKPTIQAWIGNIRVGITGRLFQNHLVDKKKKQTTTHRSSEAGEATRPLNYIR